jgi:hypothetical protein
LAESHEAKRLQNYKTILYRQQDGSWVAGIPESALAELNQVFAMIADDYTRRGLELPADTTEIVNA